MILEAEDIRKALDILNEGFLYNGIPHKNLLKFYGSYLNEVTFQTDFLNDMDEKEDDEDNNTIKESKIPLKNVEAFNNRGVTY